MYHLGLADLGKTWTMHDNIATDKLDPRTAWSLMRTIQQTTREGSAAQVLGHTATAIGETLDLERVVVLLLSLTDESSLSLASQFHNNDQLLAPQSWRVSEGSELLKMMGEAKPLPLKDLSVSSGSVGEFDQFIQSCGDESIVAFPLVAGPKVLGLLTLHQRPDFAFSDTLLELGESIARELANFLETNKLLEERELDGRAFRHSGMPSFVLEADTLKIKRVNDAAINRFSMSEQSIKQMRILELLPFGQRLVEGIKKLSPGAPAVCVSVSQQSDAEHGFEASVTLMPSSELLLILCPSQPSKGARSPAAKSDETIAALNKQISWERWVRQMVSKIHMSLDRDTLLQTVADNLGRTLGASRCLVVRTDLPMAPFVTHEYVEADISPLGLGRTTQFPAGAMSLFKSRVNSIKDLTVAEETKELTRHDTEALFDNGIRSIAGAPISHHGTSYGIIAVGSAIPKEWAKHELDVLEIVASQTAVALSNSHLFMQVKDQLFHMNLLANLTQQLTNTLEIAGRVGKATKEEQRPAPSSTATPLSLRELEVLKLIASGMANKEIANQLFLTESTVELHASRIRKKLKLKSRTALVKYACDHDLA